MRIKASTDPVFAERVGRFRPGSQNFLQGEEPKSRLKLKTKTKYFYTRLPFILGPKGKFKPPEAAAGGTSGERERVIKYFSCSNHLGRDSETI